MRYAIVGAATQTSQIGSATNSATGRSHSVNGTIMPTSTSEGSICHTATFQKLSSRRSRAARAAVVHSSSLRRRTVNRTSVVTMACTFAIASSGKKTSASSQRNTRFRSDPSSGRRCSRSVMRASTASASVSTGTPGTSNPSSVHSHGAPGRIVHPAINQTSKTGASRLRRKLSEIFQRAIKGSALSARWPK